MTLIPYLIEKVLGKLPRNLVPGEKLDVYSDGATGAKGSVGHDKINIHNGKRHFSVQSLRGTTTKMVGDTVTDQYGTPISDIRKDFDIERSAVNRNKG